MYETNKILHNFKVIFLLLNSKCTSQSGIISVFKFANHRLLGSQSEHSDNDGKTVKEYHNSLIESDDAKRKVEYAADNGGFNAEVKNKCS